MQKRIAIFIVALSCILAVVFYFLSLRVSVPDEIRGVKEFGPLKLGGETIEGPGGWTFAPFLIVPLSRFYVTVAHTDHRWCSNEDCSLDGALIQTMGGWLQIATTKNFPDLPTMVGFDKEEYKDVQSLVLVAGQNGMLVGIYPNRGLKDVLPILRLHPDLADFSLLEGVQEFKGLRVGELAPLLPGSSLAPFGSEPPRHRITEVPKDKKFYLFSVQKRKYDVGGDRPEDREGADGDKPYINKYACFIGSCRYPEPDPPHDFLFAHVEELGGWFFSSDEENDAFPSLFGISRDEVLRGESSLVVLTDSKGIIVALHPGKTLADTFTILSQHPDLADMRKFYRR